MAYIEIAWPESQELMEYDGFTNSECVIPTSRSGVYLVREDWLNNVKNGRVKKTLHSPISKRVSVCPFCGSASVTKCGDGYMCTECDTIFNEDDIIREDLRHKISLILMDTSEDNQLDCDIVLENDDEFPSMSSLDMPQIIRAYQIPCEGTIWFKVNGLVNDDDGYVNLDDISIKDLELIYRNLLG